MVWSCDLRKEINVEQDRVSYFQIKSWILENYWDGCRDHGPFPTSKGQRGWTLEQIASDVYDGYAGGEGSFDSPLEYLMLEVVCLVLACWYPAQAEYHRAQICRLLSEHALDNLLQLVPQDENDEFRHDLSILGFI